MTSDICGSYSRESKGILLHVIGTFLTCKLCMQIVNTDHTKLPDAYFRFQ